MRILRVIGLLVGLSMGTSGMSNDVNPDSCDQAFEEDNFVLIDSGGQEPHEVERLTRAMRLIEGKDGVLDKLGISKAFHEMQIAPAHELAMMASLGRYPIPHAYDGKTIMEGFFSALGVLEFVTGGCEICRSKYRDSTSLIHNISIMMHVAGHNHMALNSGYLRRRGFDPMEASKKLGDMLHQYYNYYDKDEIVRWMMVAQSFEGLQDYVYGSFEAPETFKGEAGFKDRLSFSPLQHMVVNLGSRVPQHLQRLLAGFEEVKRFQAAIPAQKMLNEGFATFLMKFLPQYYPEADSAHMVGFADLLQLAKFEGAKSLTHPYAMGLQCWERLYERYKSEPRNREKFQSMAAATPGYEAMDKNEQAYTHALIRDRQFIEDTLPIIQNMDDYEFLRTALDETWVREHGFVLYREAKPQEYDHNLPREKPEDEIQYIVTSKDPKRVLDWIAANLYDKRLHIPRVQIDQSWPYGDHVVAWKHDIPEGIPLEPKSAAQVAYLAARYAYQKTVSLETGTLYEISPEGYDYSTGSMVPPEHRTVAIRIIVDPDGKTSVEALEAVPSPVATQGSPQFVPSGWGVPVPKAFPDQLRELEEAVAEAVRQIKDEHDFYFPETSQVDDPEYKYLYGIAGLALEDEAKKVPKRMFPHAIHAAGAIDEYLAFKRMQIYRRLRAIKDGKDGYKITSKGIQIKAFPTIPKLQLDRAAKEKLSQARKFQGDVDQLTRANLHVFATEVSPSGDWILAAGGESIGNSRNARPGDRVWGPEPKSGKGEGGDEDGDPSEDGEDPSDGADDSDGSIVTLPFSVLGEILEDIELPNLQPKGGESKDYDIVLENELLNPDGSFVYEAMAEMAFSLGKKDLLKKGKRFPLPNEVIRRGFELLPQEEYVVQDVKRVPRPEVNAVVILNQDMSGSQYGEALERAKQFFFQLKARLQAKYERVEFRFVGFSNEAQEFSEKAFFTQTINGGTAYVSGYNLAHEIFEKDYPESAWDRFLFTIGDYEDFTAAASMEAFDKVSKNVQYHGSIYVSNYQPDGSSKLYGHVLTHSERDKYKGIAKLEGSDPQSVTETIRELFKKK